MARFLSRFSIKPFAMFRKKYIGRYFVGYHGCDKSIGEEILGGKIPHLLESRKPWDWLGPGVYFWVDNPERAIEWATKRKAFPGSKISIPYAIGAYVHLGLCLNLTDYGVTEELRVAYESYIKMTNASDSPVAKNDKMDSFGTPLRRALDCAVFQTVHTLRKRDNQPPYDTVLGVFEEGAPLFDGSGIREKSHIQIAVLNPADCILGYFRIPGL